MCFDNCIICIKQLLLGGRFVFHLIFINFPPNQLINPSFEIKVTSRNGAGLICAEYQGSGARITSPADEYINDDYEINEDNERAPVKTDKVSF